jgi:hypothetical protein
MIQITPHMRILLAVEPVDFRKGIDGLAQLCRQRLQSDPMAGAVFVFSNRRRKALKILCYDGYVNKEIMGRGKSGSALFLRKLVFGGLSMFP